MEAYAIGETSPALRRRQARALQDPPLDLVVDGFDMTVTGKIRTIEMREKSAAEQGGWPD